MMRPTFDDILALATGEATSRDRDAIRRAVEADPDAAAAFERVARALATFEHDRRIAPPAELRAALLDIFQPAKVAARPGWLESLRTLIASLVFDSRQPAAVAGFRSAAGAVRMGYSVGAISIDLHVETAEHGDLRTLLGQIDGAAGPFEIAIIDAAGAAVSTARTDDHGSFAIDIGPGTYDIAVRLESESVLLSDVAIE